MRVSCALSPRRVTLIALIVCLGTSGLVPAAESDNEPLKLAILDDLSGPYAENSGIGNVIAVKLAVEDIGGSMFGAPIQVLSADAQNKSDLGANIVRKWFDLVHVDAVLGMGSYAVALAVQDLARARQKVTLATTAATEDLTGKACSRYAAHWAYDTYSLSKGAAGAVVSQSGKSWCFISADDSFGQALEANATTFVKGRGSAVVGSVRHPIGTVDYSSNLLQAQASRAQVIALANAGADTINALKQASDFGFGRDNQKLISLLMQISEVRAVGLADLQVRLRTRE